MQLHPSTPLLFAMKAPQIIRTASLAIAFLVSSLTAATLTFAPTKDAMVKIRFPDTNFGTDPLLQASNKSTYEKHIFAQFTVSGIPAGSTNVVAKLHLRSQTTVSSAPITAHTVSSTSWGEATVTWNNQPALGASLSTVSSFTSGSDGIWDVSTQVTGNGTFALGLDSTYIGGDVSFGSRDSATPPSLVMTYTPPPTYNIYHGNTHAHSSYSHDSAPTNTTPD